MPRLACEVHSDMHSLFCPLRIMPSAKKKKTNKKKTVVADSRLEATHPFSIGANILAQARWFELTEQHRTKDLEHMAFVKRLCNQENISLDDFKRYKILSRDDFEDPKSPWLTAPIIVSTNRERYSLTDLAARRFARATGTIVIRWPTKWKNWKQKPPASRLMCALEDPCFYEYYVEGAAGFFSDNVNKRIGIVNARPFRMHSLTVQDEADRNLITLYGKNAQPGSVLTLSEEPVSVNVALDAENFGPDSWRTLQTLSIVDKQVVIAIVPGPTKVKPDVTVRGGTDYRPSKVTLQAVFPLELAFSITVNKSEGRTLERVILALSHQQAKLCNFDHKDLYVAMSRVDKNDHMRLLLQGRNEMEKWNSLAYLTNLRKDTSLPAFFAGYDQRADRDWKSDRWNPNEAYAAHQRLKKEQRTCP